MDTDKREELRDELREVIEAYMNNIIEECQEIRSLDALFSTAITLQSINKSIDSSSDKELDKVIARYKEIKRGY